MTVIDGVMMRSCGDSRMSFSPIPSSDRNTINMSHRSPSLEGSFTVGDMDVLMGRGARPSLDPTGFRNKKIDRMMSPMGSTFQSPTRTSCCLLESSTRTDITFLQASFASLSSYNNNSNASVCSRSASPTLSLTEEEDGVGAGAEAKSAYTASAAASTASLDASQSNSTFPSTVESSNREDDDDSSNAMSRTSSTLSVPSLRYLQELVNETQYRNTNKMVLPFLDELVDYVNDMESSNKYNCFAVAMQEGLLLCQRHPECRVELQEAIEMSMIRRLKRRARVLPYKLCKKQLELFRQNLISRSEVLTARRLQRNHRAVRGALPMEVRRELMSYHDQGAVAENIDQARIVRPNTPPATIAQEGATSSPNMSLGLWMLRSTSSEQVKSVTSSPSRKPEDGRWTLRRASLGPVKSLTSSSSGTMAEETVATGGFVSLDSTEYTVPIHDIMKRSHNRRASFSSMSLTDNDVDNAGDNGSIASDASGTTTSSISASDGNNSGSFLDGGSCSSIDTRLLPEEDLEEEQPSSEAMKVDATMEMTSRDDEVTMISTTDDLQEEQEGDFDDDYASIEASSYQLSTAAPSVNISDGEYDVSVQGSWVINFLPDENVYDSSHHERKVDEEVGTHESTDEEESASDDSMNAPSETDRLSRDDALDIVFNTILGVLDQKKKREAIGVESETSSEESSDDDDDSNASDSPVVQGIFYGDSHGATPSLRRSEDSNRTCRTKNIANGVSNDAVSAGAPNKNRQLRLPVKVVGDDDDQSEDSLEVLVTQKSMGFNPLAENNQSDTPSYNIAPSLDARQKEAVIQNIVKKVEALRNEYELGPSLIEEVLQSQSPSPVSSEEEGRPEPQEEGVGKIVKGILKRPSNATTAVTRSKDAALAEPSGALLQASSCLESSDSEYSSCVSDGADLEEPFRQELERYYANSKFRYYDHSPAEFAWSEVIILSQLGGGSFGNVYKVIGHNTPSYTPASRRKGDNCYALKCVKKGEFVPEAVPSWIRCLMHCTSSSSELAYEVARLHQEQEEEILRAHYERCCDLAIEAYLLSQMSHDNIVSLRGISSEYSFTNPFCSYAFAFSSVSPTEKKDRGFFLLMDLLEDQTLQDRLNNWRKEERLFQKALHELYGNDRASLKTIWKKITGKKASRRTTRSTSLTSWPCIVERLDRIGLGIAKGLQHIHQNEVVFRDLKPENIGFNASDGRVQIFDFGKAREQHMIDSNARGATGAPRYARYADVDAILGSHIGPENDVYSFALILWELCTLQIPYPSVDDEKYWCYKKKSLWRKLKKKYFGKKRKSSMTTETDQYMIMKQSSRPSFRVLSASRAPVAVEALIRNCWATVYQERPTMDDVVSSMQDIIECDRKENIQAATIKNIKPILKKLSSKRELIVETVAHNEGAMMNIMADTDSRAPNMRELVICEDEYELEDEPRRGADVGSGTTPPRLQDSESRFSISHRSSDTKPIAPKSCLWKAANVDDGQSSVCTAQTNDITVSTFGSFVSLSTAGSLESSSQPGAYSVASDSKEYHDKTMSKPGAYCVASDSKAYTDKTMGKPGAYNVSASDRVPWGKPGAYNAVAPSRGYLAKTTMSTTANNDTCLDMPLQ